MKQYPDCNTSGYGLMANYETSGSIQEGNFLTS